MPFGPDFISTGTALPVDPDILVGLRDELEHCHCCRYPMDTWSPHERAEVAALVVRNCLAHGAARHIRYA